jgi:hypothetical protein
MRTLRTLDPTITLDWVRSVTGLYEDEEILEARVRVEMERPADVRAFFQAQFRKAAPIRTPVRPVLAVPVRSAPDDDPYG